MLSLETLKKILPQKKTTNQWRNLEKRAAFLLEGFLVTICCESQVKSSANKWIQAGPQEEKTRGGLVIVASAQNSGFQQTFLFFYAPHFFLKRASFYLLGIPLLKQSLFFPPLIRSFISGEKKNNTKPGSTQCFSG